MTMARYIGFVEKWSLPNGIWMATVLLILHVEGICSVYGTCGVGLPVRCDCSNHTNHSINVFCEHLNLTTLPNMDLGLTTVHTFSLKGNNLTAVQTGDFFGLKVSRLILKNNIISHLNLLAFWGLEYHLDNLDLGGNRLTSIPTDALRLLRNLRTLNLESNAILLLRGHDLVALGRLEVLTLDKNPIMSIDTDAFAGTNLLLLSLNMINFTHGMADIPTKDLGKLRGLSLCDNHLSEIPTGWFKPLKCLRSLNLDSNRFQGFNNNDFDGVDKILKTLEVNNNRIKKIPKHALRKMTALESLEISHNRIRKIHSRSFNGSKCLLSIDLRYNLISDISPLAFEGLTNTEVLDLRGNHLITLDQQTLTWQGSRLREVYLADNLWLCNCLLKWVKRDYKRRRGSPNVMADISSLRCSRPDFLLDKLIIRVPMREFSCDHDYYYYYEYYTG